MGRLAPKIADFLVIRLLDAPPRPGASHAQLATTLLLDMITAFPHANLEEFSQGIRTAQMLVSWKADESYDEQLVVLSRTIKTMFQP